MIYIHEVSQEMFFDTPKGKAKVFALIYRGSEANLKWLCFQQETGEIWEWEGHECRAEKNITLGRRVDEHGASVKTTSCPACFGIGRINKGDALGFTSRVVCSTCSGTGRYAACRKCGGLGLVKDPEGGGMERCHSCAGLGHSAGAP